MGIIYDNFKDKTFELWGIAHKLKKPLRDDISWSTGIIQGRSDYKDLQVQFLGLAASIIVCEKKVPEIILAWDSPESYRNPDKGHRGTGYPEVIFDCMKPEPFVCKHNRDLFREHIADTVYVTVRRAALSVNSWCGGLGRGYRAKWGGLRYVCTPLGILSDADTICMNPCVDYLVETAKKKSNTFCWTTWKEKDKINVGLCVFNMAKLNAVFNPLLSRLWWLADHKDSEFVQTVRKAFPKYAKALKLGLLDKKKVNSERYAAARKYGKDAWSEDSGHYHAWKKEFSKGGQKALDHYGGILDKLIVSARAQIDVQDD